MSRVRIDKLLVDRGFAETRTRAHAIVMSGVVLVDEKRVEKPSEMFAPDAAIRLKGATDELRYASRAGLKLEAALEKFGLAVTDLDCIDIGSSTGGFTDCLLRHGAKRVVAVDAGTNQMVWSLRNDPRVEVRERTNARELKREDFATQFDAATIDVSFISLTKILPAVLPLVKRGGAIVVLIKPQFEVGKNEVGKGGIVRDPAKHQRVVEEINTFARNTGLSVKGVIDSPILGAEGNKEFLAFYEKDPQPEGRPPRAFLESVDFYYDDGLMVLTRRFLLERGYCCENRCRNCPYGNAADTDL